jgi:hypothetical protein
MKIKFARGMLVGLMAVLLVLGLYLVLNAQSGAVLEQWETTNGAFKVRVRRRPELLNFLPRYYYEFESQVRGAKRWKTITTLLLDDPVPVPRNQVRFLNNETGYLFMSSAYAVTTDCGKQWSLFNVRTDPPLGTSDSYLTIREVQMESNGSGMMTVYSKSAGSMVELRTKDYGRHWSAE